MSRSTMAACQGQGTLSKQEVAMSKIKPAILDVDEDAISDALREILWILECEAQEILNGALIDEKSALEYGSLRESQRHLLECELASMLFQIGVHMQKRSYLEARQELVYSFDRFKIMRDQFGMGENTVERHALRDTLNRLNQSFSLLVKS